MALTQISTAGVKDDAVTSGKIPANAVGSSELADNAVDTAAIAANAVTNPKIVSGAIDTGHLADNAVTTAKIANDAIDGNKIADDAVGGAAILNNSISTSKIQDNAITLAKLPHGDGSSDGKFLRANNGADPTFESVPSPAITGISNATNNRVLTSEGGTTVNSESNLIFNGTNLGVGLTSPQRPIHQHVSSSSSNYHQFTNSTTGSGSGDGLVIGLDANEDAIIWNQETEAIRFGTSNAEQMRIVSNGEVGIGLTDPEAYGANGNGSMGLTVQAPSGNYSAITVRSGYNGAGSLNFADGSGSHAERRNGFIDCDHVNQRLNIGLNGSSVARFTTHGFHPNPADSAAANALDDYEEGTYVPTVNSNMSLQSSYDTFSYVKIGKTVTIRGLFYPNNNPSSNNVMTISLPFASANYTQIAGAGATGVMHRQIAGASNGVALYIQDNVNYAELYKNGGSGNWQPVRNNDWQSGLEIYVQTTYFAA